MEPRYLELAAELCDIAHQPDLFALLDVPEDADASACAEAMAAFRRKMQGMQANPKWKDTARFAIKHHQAIASVLTEPDEYRAHIKRKAEDATLPSLLLAIDGTLVMGDVHIADTKFEGLEVAV